MIDHPVTIMGNAALMPLINGKDVVRCLRVVVSLTQIHHFCGSNYVQFHNTALHILSRHVQQPAP